MGSKHITPVYRKPTFTGQYLNWKFFSPGKRKVGLISTLGHRALMICFLDFTVQAELRKFFSILLINGYPDHIIEKTIVGKLKDFTSPTLQMLKKCPVDLYSLPTQCVQLYT